MCLCVYIYIYILITSFYYTYQVTFSYTVESLSIPVLQYFLYYKIYTFIHIIIYQ